MRSMKKDSIIDLKDLVATKGSAAPVQNMESRVGMPINKPSESVSPLNFRVTKEFRKEFKSLALEKDLKLNELLVFLLKYYKEKEFKSN